MLLYCIQHKWFLTVARILTVFLVGFVTRHIVNYIFNVNVFVEYTSTVSIVYYMLFSGFVVYISDLFATQPSRNLSALATNAFSNVASPDEHRRGLPSNTINSNNNTNNAPLPSLVQQIPTPRMANVGLELTPPTYPS